MTLDKNHGEAEPGAATKTTYERSKAFGKIMIRLITVLTLAISTVHATQVEDRSLEDLITEADHVVIGKVETVKMYGLFGIPYPNPSARTGPGSPNELRWDISVQKSGVLYSKKKDFPAKFVIKLWRRWHMDLESARSHEGKTYILLLKGDDLQWVYPAFFYRDPGEIEEVKALIKKKKEPNLSAPDNVRELPGFRSSVLHSLLHPHSPRRV